MNLLITLFATTFIHMVFFVAVVKVLTGNFKVTYKKFIFMLALTLLACFIKTFVLFVELPNLSAAMLSGVTYVAFLLLHGPKLFVYYFKAEAYNAKNAIAFSFNVISIALAADMIVSLIYATWFPSLRLFAYMTILEYPLQVVANFLLHIIVSFILAMLFAYLLTPKLIKANVSKKTTLLFLIISVVVCVALAIMAAFFYSMEVLLVEEVWLWSVIFIIFFMYIAIVGILIHSRFSEIKNENMLKEAALLSLQKYQSNLEQQQLAVRKFQHDYQNILLPLKEFISNEQWDDLKRYFLSEVIPSSEIITKNKFVLADLNKIHVPEIKSLFVTKLVLAQNLNFDATFEADEDIKSISLDLVALVRMLEAMFDNAFEDLAEQETGELRVGCLKAEGGVTFIVQNTHTSNEPQLNEMATLTSLSNSYKNVFTTTSIEDGYFTQQLVIEDIDI